MEDQSNLKSGIEELLFQLSMFNERCINYLLNNKTPSRTAIEQIKDKTSNHLKNINNNKLRKAYENFIFAINEFLQVKKEVITQNAFYTLDSLVRLIGTYSMVNATTQNSSVDFPKLTDEDKKYLKQELDNHILLTISDLFAYSVEHASQKGRVENHLINGTQKLIDMYNLLGKGE